LTKDTDGYDAAAVRSVYDDLAADYAVRFGSELADADGDNPDLDFLDAALTAFPDGPVLDIGCGPAQVSRYLIGRGRKAVGIDFAPAMLAAAARLVPPPSLVLADLLELPIQPGSCAGVVASYSLHHLPKSRLATALERLRDVLRVQGMLVIITHGGSGEERHDQPGGEVVLSKYEPAELDGRLRAAGFTPELVRVRKPKPGEYPADKIRIAARVTVRG
jgi:SAM-dependent methyltransferase